MIQNIEIIVNNEAKTIVKGTTLYEVSKDYQNRFSYKILIAKVDNVFTELSTPIIKSCHIEFFDLKTRLGNRIYVSGLIFLTLTAIKDIFGNDKNMTVCHAIDKGLYVTTSFKISAEDINKIMAKMKELVERDLVISKINISRIDAIEYFKSINDLPKASIMKYNTNTFITLYRLENYYNYFYNYMPYSTRAITDFDLTYLDDSSFVLRFPTVYHDGGIKEYTEHKGMLEIFKERREWSTLMHIENVGDLNNLVSTGNIADLIRIEETVQSTKLLYIAKNIYEHRDKIKIILVAGPSSSGKTTSTKKLRMYLQTFGLKPKMLSMDDYFLEREETPKNEKGEYDFECLEAIDLKLFDTQVERILRNEEVNIPTFNFVTGSKEYKKKMQLDEGEVLIIEGIHGLNSRILTNIPRENKYKIYLTALMELNLDEHNYISTTDNRLIRRLIRDNRTRGYPIETTLKNWQNVRVGEEKFIFPYQDEPDCIVNTAFMYEMGVLKTYAEPLLYSVDVNSKYYEEAKRLINFLKVFLPIPSDEIPLDSILREFIGGSNFSK